MVFISHVVNSDAKKQQETQQINLANNKTKAKRFKNSKHCRKKGGHSTVAKLKI